MIKALPTAVAARDTGKGSKSSGKIRGERVLEGEFHAHAIATGNTVGYETIVASGANATTLHWMRNTSDLQDGELLLIDAGVEVDSLYTADITRTFPIDGKFNYWQRQIYEAVLAAADAAFKVVRPGNRFRDVHDAAMEVIVEKLISLKILTVSADQALSPTGQEHRRWMFHGTSHHLGLDVHDCARARNEMYYDGILQPGMVFTIEPGLYFKPDDLLVPNEYRGIGVRIEDDILVTETGAKNLSASIPRMPEHVESWMSTLLKSKC
jgi:Xaa-Pro aminopeptidase